MKKHLLAAAAALLALGGTAYAGGYGFSADAEEACMHYGVTSSSCQYYRREQQEENRLQQLEQQERAYQQRCSMFGRC